MKDLSLIKSIAFMTSLAMLVLSVPGSVINVPLDYPTIQQAIDAALAPDMRLRNHSFRTGITKGHYYASYVKIVPGSGAGQAMPTEPTEVAVYFWPPGTVGHNPEIIMAFDGIDIELAPLWGGTIDLHSVTVEMMSGYPPH